MTIEISNDYRVAKTTTLNFVDETAFMFVGPGQEATLLNLGKIIVTSDAVGELKGVETHWDWNGDGLFQNKGLLSVTATHTAYGVYAGMYALAVENTGHIKVSAGEHAIGVYFEDFSGPFVNEGKITVSGTWAVGVDIDSSPSFINDGQITANSKHGQAIAFSTYRGVEFFTNNGTITATNSNNTFAAIGVRLSNVFDQIFTNTGTVIAEHAIEQVGFFSGSPGRITVNNSGELRGDVVFWAGDHIIINNTGLINGEINADGSSDFIYDGAGGTLTGMVSGSSGADVFIGGKGHENFVGAQGDDTLTGGGGADVLSGGSGNDRYLFNSIKDTGKKNPDLITDFFKGDRIDLSVIDADRTVDGKQAFHLGGGGAHAGDIVVTYDAANGRTVLDLYVDADAKIDATIWLSGDWSNMKNSDFIF